MLRKLIPILLLAVVAALVPQKQAYSQLISEADTFKVMPAFGQPGDIVPIKLFVVNPDTTLMAINAYFDIDTTKVEYVGVVDQGTFFVNVDSIDRAFEGVPAGQCVFNFQPLVMATSNGKRASVIGAGDGGDSPGDQLWIRKGRGNVLQFYVRIKDNLNIGDQTVIRIYNPFDDDPGDFRGCSYSDHLGLRTVYPRIVSGVLTVGEGQTGGTNSPPSIAALSQTSYAVTPGTPINFSVSASDPNAGQTITLSASGLPSGATFGSGGSVTGAGAVTGNFSWTPNASQINSYSITFTCVDDSSASATPRSVNITVTQQPPPEGDVIYTVSQRGIGPVSGGTPGLTGISIPVNLSSESSVFGVQFDFVYNSDVLIVDSLVPTDRLQNFTVYENIGDISGRVRVVAFGLNNEEIQTTSTPEIMNFWVTVRGSAPIGESELRFENAYESISPDPFVPSVELETDDNGIFVVDAGGDVNGDGRVDIADMVVVVAYIIEDIELNARQFSAADMDRNGFVDVIDLQAIINQVFGGTPPSFVDFGGDEAVLELYEPSAAGSQGVTDIYAELPTDVAGVQFEISYNPEKVQLQQPERTALSSNLALRYKDDGLGRMIVLLYPGSAGLNNYMKAGTGTLLSFSTQKNTIGELTNDDLKINYAVMVDPDAVEVKVKNLARKGGVLPEDFTLQQNFPNPFNPETTINFAIEANSARRASLKIYNLLGQHVHTLVDDVLAPGEYSYTWYGRMENGTPAASGVYFYRLTIGDQAKTRKMVLLK